MLSSISTGKSSSNWLHRLRSSKGFPASNDLDLEQFLNHNKCHLSNSSDIKDTDSTTNNIDPKSNSNPIQSDESAVLDCNQTTETSNQNGEKELFSIVSNVLSELFNMGDSDNFPRIHGKKSSRKQPNPRIFVVSTSANNVDNIHTGDDVRRDEGISPTLRSSGDSSRVETKETSDDMKPVEQQDDVDVGEQEEEKSHANLSSFSKTEVTVIDTSCPSWKFEKLLFRKKNVWKVRDKKCKTRNVGKKKRKAGPVDESIVGKKKLKVSVVRRDSLEEENGEECIRTSNEGHHQSEKTEEACKTTADFLIQVPKNRFPKKLKKGGSSVILIKSIPLSKKKKVSIPRRSLKSTLATQGLINIPFSSSEVDAAGDLR